MIKALQRPPFVIEPCSHYSINTIEDMADVRRLFGDEGADDMNWFFCSTSGIHGHYATLDKLETYFADPTDWSERFNGGEPYTPTLTVFIVQPRRVTVFYGDIPIEASDIPYLRMLVATTLEGVKNAQNGNYPKA